MEGYVKSPMYFGVINFFVHKHLALFDLILCEQKNYNLSENEHKTFSKEIGQKCRLTLTPILCARHDSME